MAAITLNMLLEKMERELILAKQENVENAVREHIYAMKALCELVLDHIGNDLRDSDLIGKIEKKKGAAAVQVERKGKPLVTEDGANGDSIFEF